MVKYLVALLVKGMVAMVGWEIMVISSVVVKVAEIMMYNQNIMHYSLQAQSLTTTFKELHLANCKRKNAAKYVHQHFLSVEVDIDADIPTTCWLYTLWDCSNIYMWGTCSCCIPDIKIIWYSIESQSGKASDIITIVVQCDGSQGDSCGEYEQ